MTSVVKHEMFIEKDTQTTATENVIIGNAANETSTTADTSDGMSESSRVTVVFEVDTPRDENPSSAIEESIDSKPEELTSYLSDIREIISTKEYLKLQHFIFQRLLIENNTEDIDLNVNDGKYIIECCNNTCKTFVHRDEITLRLSPEDKLKFYQHLVDANADPRIKTCPTCSHVTSFPKEKSKCLKNTKSHPQRSRVQCSQCELWWCFYCHAPWHSGLTCKQYLKGDRLMKTWAKKTHHGQVNAQKCPRCKVYIQRTVGCDHMHCTRCGTKFCYRCGDRLLKVRYFGGHYNKFSIFGCKYKYKADKPFQRKFVRAAVFGSQLMIVPLLGTLGIIALGLGLFIIPVYMGGMLLYYKVEYKFKR
ncbi:hypothetical protein CHUAL_006997 [Chamberlinius hualienensis]